MIQSNRIVYHSPLKEINQLPNNLKLKKMKTKLKMIVLLIIMAQVTISGKLIAAPIFGLPGQGTPSYNPMDGSMGCDPGWHWCKFEMTPEKNHSIDATAFEMTEEGEVTVTCPIDYLKIKYTKMFVRNNLVISYPVPLDTKISTALATQLNKKNNAQLFLEPGSYSYEVVGEQIRIPHVKVGDMKHIGKAFSMMRPPFAVDKIEILCCGRRNSTKKIHVVSNTLSGSGTSLQVKDASGNIIASYPNLVADFTTPCLNLTGGQSYSIGFIDMNGNEFTGFTQTIMAPKCWLENKLGPSPKPDKLNLESHKRKDYVGHVTLLRYTELYLGYGRRYGICRNEAIPGIATASSMSGHIYVPLLRSKKGWDGTVKGRVSFGLTAGIMSTLINSTELLNKNTMIPVSDMPVTSISLRGSGSPKVQGFKYELGPQMNITKGAFTLSPGFQLGYECFKIKEFSIEQSGKVNGSEQTIQIFKAPQSISTGLVMTPKLRLAYNPGRIGVWIEGQYSKGPALQISGSMLKPSGNPDKTGGYSYVQIVEGTSIPSVQKNSLPCVGVSAGLVLSLKRKHD